MFLNLYMPGTSTWLSLLFGVVDAGVKYAVQYQPPPRQYRPLSYDEIIKSVEPYFPNTNDILIQPEELSQPRQRTPLGSNLSFKGQDADNYCLECLTRHYSKAYGLLDEGKRFALKEGKITPEARERIRSALTEIVTAEEDLGTNITDPELKEKINEINIKQRDLRKWMWSAGLPTVNENLDSLDDAINRAKDLMDTTYSASEVYASRHPEGCTTCDQKKEKLISMLEEVENKARSKRLELLNRNAIPQSS